ncbi:hypothetical protein V6N13_084161 [Hibiscus sabdariffa]
MSSSTLYLLLTLAFFLQTALGADPLFHFCSDSENFSAYDPYEPNLHKLTAFLSIQAPPSGFGMGSIGQNPNQAYGLALCRGDVSSQDCETCVVEAGTEIRKRCPYTKTFNHKTKQLLTELANEAYANPKLYAAGETKLYGSEKLYGLTQCTRDLSTSDCKKCLDGIINKLPSCCDGKQGGRVVGDSCNFRYEIYPFLNSL